MDLSMLGSLLMGNSISTVMLTPWQIFSHNFLSGGGSVTFQGSPVTWQGDFVTWQGV